MFRIGGSTNEGIVSMAQPRRNYEGGSDYATRIAELRPILQEAAGAGRSERDRVLDMLLRGSIRLASERPAGNIFSTAAKAFQEPVEQYLKSGAEEDAFQRQINLAAATQGISSVEAERLARLKLQAEQQALSEKDRELFLKTSGLGPISNMVYDTKRALEKRGETVVGAVSTVGSGDKAKPVPSAVLTIPENTLFYDVNGNFYRRVKEGPGWKRVQLSGEEIKVEAPVKKTGFTESLGASYDPRAWNKKRFYEELAKKNTPSSME